MLTPKEYLELGELLAIIGPQHPGDSIQDILYRAQKFNRPTLLSQGGIFKALDSEILDSLRKYAKKS
jgi:hypothetical protein